MEDVVIGRTSFGKPYLLNEAIQFNLSHCRGAVLAGLSRAGIGVDIECERSFTDLQHFYRLIASREERQISPQIDAVSLRRLWAGKESLVKLVGTGFHLHPSSLSVMPALTRGQGPVSVGRHACHLFWPPETHGLVSCLATVEPASPSLWDVEITDTKTPSVLRATAMEYGF
ncbi:4'-phosphopantetheinyl transferase family protein [Paludibacterium paludis]|uniref:4'-phosphopantetheinyl transferase domain-containing protein n=1 Tax=Paludibacterium paludis TaxID=1225769 RepID=A0A918U8F6_9NEIS|nr:4'-phosphopantetheinyl transferase superfamily protein [Paludibacterium paludis]GGY11287.1 hypothetical protein GCM10011289_12760 [Paludibacterium paludis]